MLIVATYALVIGALLALVGIILTDVPNRGTKLYKLYRAISMGGAGILLIGILAFISGSQITPRERQCENDLGGVYLLQADLCLDDQQLPIITLPED